LYVNGVGVPADLALAREWMQKPAAAGNEPAKQWLAAQLK
jgi:TPR repeat protein